MTTQEFGSLVVICINAGALIWGAATLASSVRHLTGVVSELKALVNATSDKLHTLHARISVLESEWDGIERRHHARRENPEV